jgi:hypothetical protein
MAAPKPIPYLVENLEEIPESLRPWYVEGEDGQSMRLLVDGVAPKSKLEEFRDNNKELNQRLAEAERQMTVYRALAEDPDKLKQEYERLQKLEQRFKNKELIESEGFEKAVEQRTAEMKSASEGQIRVLSEALNKRESELQAALRENEQIIISRALTDAALAAGVVPAAIPDVLSRGTRDGWVLNEKKVPIMMRNGEIVFGDNAVDPLTPREWASRTLRDSAPWFFNQASGTGASGANIAGGSINPWTATHWNVTKQSEFMQKEGIAKAEQMAKAAGSSLTAIHPPKAA